jgi:hypothetical protein
MLSLATSSHDSIGTPSSGARSYLPRPRWFDGGHLDPFRAGPTSGGVRYLGS